jgi:hypothetical protein
MEPEKRRLGFELMKFWSAWLRRFRRIGDTPETRIAAARRRIFAAKRVKTHNICG